MLELCRQNTLKPCSARPGIDLAGGCGCSERFKYVNVLMGQGDGSAGVDCGSDQGLRESWVPDRAEQGMRAQTSEAFAKPLPSETVGLACTSAKRLR